MSNELKPCPFCGKEPVIRKTDEYFVIECNNLKCPVFVAVRFRLTEKEAIKAWNKRVKE